MPNKAKGAGLVNKRALVASPGRHLPSKRVLTRLEFESHLGQGLASVSNHEVARQPDTHKSATKTLASIDSEG